MFSRFSDAPGYPLSVRAVRDCKDRNWSTACSDCVWNYVQFSHKVYMYIENTTDDTWIFVKL